MDGNSITTDDDRQTPSIGQSSSDDISSVITEKLSTVVYDNDQRRMSNTSSTHAGPEKIINRSSLPNFKIKHPYQSDDNDYDLFDDEKRIITDEHVKVSHINRASLCSLTTKISLPRLDACSRRKSTGNVTVSRGNKRISHAINNNNQTNRESTQIISRQNTVRANQTPTTANIKQDFGKKVTSSKPMVTRVSFSNELPLKMSEKELHVAVKHISVNQNETS